jgi:hypothetical protein
MMKEPPTESEILSIIRRLAEAPERVDASKQARSDMMAHNLRLDDVCEAIIESIDAKARFKAVTLHSFQDRVGQTAWEVKPRINDMLFYIKITLDDQGGPNETLVILSCHPDH